MSDLIDRQAAIEAIASRDETDGTIKVFTGREVNGILADLPSASQQAVELQGHNSSESVISNALTTQQWIPCSERLPEHPENDDYYLVTIQCEHYDGWDDYVTGFAEWTKHGWDELSCYIGQIKVVAWMPLPEPYKGEEE